MPGPKLVFGDLFVFIIVFCSILYGDGKAETMGIALLNAIWVI